MDEEKERMSRDETEPSTCEESSSDDEYIDPRTGAKMRKESMRAWAVQNRTDFFPIADSTDSVPSGQYVAKMKNGEIYLSLNTVNTDDVLKLPDSASEEVLDNIEDFWNNEDGFRNYGFLWKRGILLFGPPGGGKTCTVQLISKMIIERNGITLYVQDPELAEGALKILRRIEPNRNVVVILEDLDSMIEMNGESEILSLLDGELQIDNVVFLATTNYPEKLDKRIINRPSRFDMVKRIDMPNRESRKLFLETKGLDDETIEEWLELTDEFSIAHLKEMIVSVRIMGNDLYETVERLRSMMTDVPTSDDDGGSGKSEFGFTSPKKRRKGNVKVVRDR